MLARDQHILAIGRKAHAFENPGLAERRHFRGRRVDRHQLRGGIVFVQIFVMRILQQILIRRDAARAAIALLHVRTFRNTRFGGRGASAGGNGFDDDGFIVRQPVDGIAVDTVQLDARDLVRLAGGGIAEPQLDAVGTGVREREHAFHPATSAAARACAFGGRSSLIFVPSGSFTSSTERLCGARCNPLVRGSMRMPARRSMGSETSAIEG